MELPPAPWEGGGPSALVAALTSQRSSRELAARLRLALRDASAQLPHLRMRSLRQLATLLETVATSEDLGALFCDSQLYPDLQVVPVLLEHSLPPLEKRTTAGNDAAVMWRVSQEVEALAALRVLEGCCLLDASSRSLAARHGAAKELLDRLETSNSTDVVKAASLDALLAVLFACPASQQAFKEMGGVGRVSRVLKNRLTETSIRRKCAEFLQLLLEPAGVFTALEGSDGRQRREEALLEASTCLGAPAGALLGSGASGGAILTSSQLQARVHLLLDSLQ